MPYLALLALALLVADFSRVARAPDARAIRIGSPRRAPLDSVLPNDNRAPAGTVRGATVDLVLEARLARWRPGLHVDTMVTVQAFGEAGGAPRIPGPLLRTTSGTEVRVTVRNTLDSTLVVHGLRAGTLDGDTVTIAPGATREIRFTAGSPGSYLYWGTTTGSPMRDRPWRDSQLTGAIVIDDPRAPRDTAERVFVITVLDIFRDDTLRNKAKEDVWERAINGRGWPHNERLTYAVGDTVRWRWLNGSYLPHPMHLHGFHFTVHAKGSGTRDTVYDTRRQRLAVTEFMLPGATFSMSWTPTRAGHWLMHCHMIPHITPFPDRPDSARGHDLHDVTQHPLTAMQGLVLGVTTVERARARPVAGAPAVARRIRLFAQQSRADSGKLARRSYVIQRGAVPAADSTDVTSAPLVLRQGETTAITVLNRLREPTTVHWHGMELESVYDGVSGWSRTGGSVAPLVAPGDSFTAVITPPRAGTYIYHTHMDEGPQILTGLYGPMIVLAPGERYDPATDLTFVMGGSVKDGKTAGGVNGLQQPATRTLRVGTRYRLRFINILFAEAPQIRLARSDSIPVTWTPIAKDGATLPAAYRVRQPAFIRRIGVGETYDYELTPTRTGDIVVTYDMGTPFAKHTVTGILRVR